MQVKDFNGLNNVGDTLNLGASWLSTADNMNVTAAGKLQRRDGYLRKIVANVPLGAAYATDDEERAYYVDAGALKTFEGVTLRAGMAGAPMHWAEINGDVYFNNGTDRGIIRPDNSLLEWAWPVPGAPALAAVTGLLAAGLYRVRCTFTLADGRETGPGDAVEILLGDGQALQISSIPQLAGARTNVYLSPANSAVFSFADTPLGTYMLWNASPDNLGLDATEDQVYPMPSDCSVIEFWRGKMYVAMPALADDVTYLWFSQALGFHLFNTADDFLAIPGQVLILAPHALGLVIGTERQIFAWDGSALSLLASYGVVPGHGWSKDADGQRVLMWTKRGLCAALPFENLTQSHLSVAPGLHAGGAVLEINGDRRFVATLQKGGTAFNPRK